MALPEFGPVDPSWIPVLQPFESTLHELANFLEVERSSGYTTLPETSYILRSLTLPSDEIRVVIVGQDPYPTPGHAHGLAFSVASDVQPLPRSLANIFRELSDDIGAAVPEDGNLEGWSKQGVLLLNRCLTVRAGAAGSHRGKGWEQITAAVLEHLAARGTPLVAILWGREAQQCAQFLPGVPLIKSAHPSPLSARRGFFGSHPFSRCNTLLEKQGAHAIDWANSH